MINPAKAGVRRTHTGGHPPQGETQSAMASYGCRTLAGVFQGSSGGRPSITKYVIIFRRENRDVSKIYNPDKPIWRYAHAGPDRDKLRVLEDQD